MHSMAMDISKHLQYDLNFYLSTSFFLDNLVNNHQSANFSKYPKLVTIGYDTHILTVLIFLFD